MPTPSSTSANSQPMALLMADTDATQSYVFESNKLPEIRGGSRWLTDLNEDVARMTEKAGGRRVYAGGGGLLAFVPANQATDVVAAVEAYFPRETGAATITAVARPLPPGYTEDQFKLVVDWLSYLLRQRKESKPAPPFWETLPHQVRCESCQKRPAAAGYAANWCPICYRKRRYQKADAWFNDFSRSLSPAADYGRGHLQDAQSPQDLSEIGAASVVQPGYVGFIYLDGDRIGRLLQEDITTADDYRRFSETMRDVTRTAVFSALAANLQVTSVSPSPSRQEVGQTFEPGETIWIHPFEIITIGGDDVLLIVPAHAALPIALSIGQQFGAAMTQFVQNDLRLSRTLSMSGGVVIAEHHTPVRVLYGLAEQLQDEAKKLDGGGLDFLVLKSNDMLDNQVSDVRDNYPYLLKGGDRRTSKDLRLLARPYSYDHLSTLWQDLRRLKTGGKLANSQMHLLAQSLLDGRAPSTLYFEYQQKRYKAAYSDLRKLLENLQTTGKDHPLPWEKISGQDFSYQTALWDLAELYDFVPG